MAKKAIKSYSLSEMKDKYIGKADTAEREVYEYELRMDVLGRMIKSARLERNLTQEQLGKLVGVQKAQISKLESSASSATIDTILKVFKALNATVVFLVASVTSCIPRSANLLESATSLSTVDAPLASPLPKEVILSFILPIIPIAVTALDLNVFMSRVSLTIFSSNGFMTSRS